MTKRCPCGSNEPYTQCCGAFISGERLPATPEQLMRSRYTAFTQANVEYIFHTMKSPAADHFDKQSTHEWAKTVKWQQLKVLNTAHEGNKGYVEFVAYFSEKQMSRSIHEISEFHLIDGAWFYIDGKQRHI